MGCCPAHRISWSPFGAKQEFGGPVYTRPRLGASFAITRDNRNRVGCSRQVGEIGTHLEALKEERAFLKHPIICWSSKVYGGKDALGLSTINQTFSQLLWGRG